MIPYQLNMKSGPTPGKNFTLDKPELLIGRELVNDIVISDADVSRKHARLAQQGEDWLVEDLASTNGTYVNGERLFVPHLLQPGDQIKLGETVELVFEALPVDAQATRIAPDAPLEPLAVDVPVKPVFEAFPRPQEFPDLQMPEAAVEVLDGAEVPAFEPALRDAAPVKDSSKRNLTIGLIVGGSCLLLLCVCVALAAVVYFIVAPVAQ